MAMSRNVAGFNEKVVLAPCVLLGCRGFSVVGARKGVSPRGVRPPSGARLCFISQARKNEGNAFLALPRAFPAGGEGWRPRRCFFLRSPLLHLRCGYLFPRRLASSPLHWEHGLLLASLRAVGCARRVWRGGMLPPRAGESGGGRLVGAMRSEPRGSRAPADSSRAPPPFWLHVFPSGSPRGPRPGSWRWETSLLMEFILSLAPRARNLAAFRSPKLMWHLPPPRPNAFSGC